MCEELGKDLRAQGIPDLIFLGFLAVLVAAGYLIYTAVMPL